MQIQHSCLTLVCLEVGLKVDVSVLLVVGTVTSEEV